MSHTHITTSVTELVCNHIKCDIMKKNYLTFSHTTNSSCSPTHSSLSIELFWSPRHPDHTLSVSKFATLSSVSPKSRFFFSWLPLIHAFSLSSTCYTLLFTITSIKSLPSTPWLDLFPVLSFWAYDFSPRSLLPAPSLYISSCLRNLLSYTLHTSLLCWLLSSFFHGTLTHLTL